MKVVLIDNEDNIREGLKELIQSFCPNIEIIGEANGVETGYDLIKNLRPELVFLDVEMDDGTGMDLLSKFIEINFQVIFCTAHDKYAINAFKFSAIDFLLKPVDPEDLISAVQKALESAKESESKLQIETLLSNFNKSSSSQKIVLKDAESVHVVKIEDIFSLEAEGSYTKFTLSERREILVSKNLKEYEQLLLQNNFFRTHHSYLVNLNKVIRFDKKDGGTLVLEEEYIVPVSVRKKDDLIEKLSSL